MYSENPSIIVRLWPKRNTSVSNIKKSVKKIWGKQHSEQTQLMPEEMNYYEGPLETEERDDITIRN